MTPQKQTDHFEQFYYFVLIFVCCLVVALAWMIVPHGKQCYGNAPWYLNCDFSLWFQASAKFPIAFKYGNILVHRPLFAAIEAPLFWTVNLLSSLKQPLDELKVFVLTWRLQNIFFYFGLVFFAYQNGKRLWGKLAGFFLALLVATSEHTYAWLMQPLNNIQGFFITFFVWWMVLDWYQEKTPQNKRLKLIFYSLIFGTLMLGKAMYNLLATILAVGLFFERKNWRNLLKFFVLQAVPLLIWLLFINIVLKTPYKNYEMRLGTFYFIENYFKDIKTIPDFLLRIAEVLKSPLTLSVIGIGWVPTLMGIMYLGKIFASKLWWMALIYIIMTNGLLFASSFALVRHAPDYWPIVYGGTAYWLAEIPHRFADRNKLMIITVEVVILLLGVLISFDNNFIQNRNIF